MWCTCGIFKYTYIHKITIIHVFKYAQSILIVNHTIIHFK